MPASKFLVQTDTAVFDELVNASSLPCFTTDYGQRRLQTAYPGRVNIPLTGTEASVTFFLASRRKMPGFDGVSGFPSARFPYTGLTGFRNPDFTRCSVSSDSSYAS